MVQRNSARVQSTFTCRKDGMSVIREIETCRLA
jgi:hypothetical protein